MKKIFIIAFITTALYNLMACQAKEDAIGDIGPAPTNGKITVNSSDPYNPVFTATADNGFIYHWDLGNGALIAPGKTQATSYYPFAGTYNVKATIYGAGAKNVVANTTFNVAKTDPTVFTKPMWKELTGSGAGKTWVYNTDTETGEPDYSYQTVGDLVTYPDNWKPSGSWGQCVRVTPDIKGEMIFDLNNGINYTYHHTAGDEGKKGTFILNTEKKTLTIINPYILDYNIQCTNPNATATGTYDIKLLTDDEMILWQNQLDGTGWSWSFRRKGYNP